MIDRSRDAMVKTEKWQMFVKYKNFYTTKVFEKLLWIEFVRREGFVKSETWSPVGIPSSKRRIIAVGKWTNAEDETPTSTHTTTFNSTRVPVSHEKLYFVCKCKAERNLTPFFII